MWGRKPKAAAAPAAEAQPGRLKEAIRQTRIEMAERSGVVVDLRDAELARLELLNEALDPLFSEIPPEIDLFDRGISRGDTPRLWVDDIAHIVMGPDKRRYRFVQDTRYGRKILADSGDMAEVVDAVTHYVAARIIDRERAIAAADAPPAIRSRPGVIATQRRLRWRIVRAFVLGVILGGAALLAALWLLATWTR